MPHTQQQAEALHARLQALTKRVDSERIYFRKPGRAHRALQNEIPSSSYATSDRDRVVCGLAAKAAATHAAIGVLVAGQFSADSMALTRVLMENVFSLSWILQDIELRADLYWLSPALSRMRVAEMAVKHYTHRPAYVESAKDFMANTRVRDLCERLAGSWDKWARRDRDGKLTAIGARGIFHDLGITLPDGTKQSFAYDVMYFIHSQYVHSMADSTAFLGKRTQFTLSPPADGNACLIALNSANVFLIQGLADFEKYIGTPCFQPELDEIWNVMQEQIKALIEPPP